MGRRHPRIAKLTFKTNLDQRCRPQCSRTLTMFPVEQNSYYVSHNLGICWLDRYLLVWIDICWFR